MINQLWANYFVQANESSSSVPLYAGNNLNNLKLMKLASYLVEPSDAHSLVRCPPSLVFNQRGGDGFVRAFIEKLLRIDLMSVQNFMSQELS